MKHWIRKAAVLVLALSLTLGMTGCGSRIDGTKTAVTVNGESISLGQLSFDAHYQAAMMYTYYNQYMSGGYFDMIYDEETGTTYGKGMVDSTADDLADLLLISQHAADYGIALTDEEKAEIDTVAQQYIDANDKETRDKIGASKEDVVKNLTLYKIQEKMHAAIGEEVDPEIPDDEAQQTSISFLTMTVPSKESVQTEDPSLADADDEKIAEAIAAADEEVKATMQQVLDELLARDDNATLDLKEFGTPFSEKINGGVVGYTTNAETPEISAALVEKTKGLEEGEIYPEVFKNTDGSQYYIARLDKVFDEEKTETKKASLLRTKKTEHYDEVLAAWREAASIEKNADEIGKIVLTDKNLFLFKLSEEELAAMSGQ